MSILPHFLLILAAVFTLASCGRNINTTPNNSETAHEEIPTAKIDQIEPAIGAQGTELTATITGSNLDKTSEVRLGGGITVTRTQILSENELDITFVIAPKAAIGTRNIVVISPQGTVKLMAGFEIVASNSSPTPSPSPGASPSPSPMPSPPPAGSGFISGSAVLKITNIPASANPDKEVLFCIYDSKNGSYVEVRHRQGGTVPKVFNPGFQIKGGLLGAPSYCGSDESHVYKNQPMPNGEWTVDWNASGVITVRSPTGSQTIQVGGTTGRPAYDKIVDGACPKPIGIIRSSSEAKVEVVSFTGTVGAPIINCN